MPGRQRRRWGGWGGAHLAGVVRFDGVLPVGVRGVRAGRRTPRGEQPLAQGGHLLVLGGRGRRGGAEVQRRAQPVLRRLRVGAPPTTWGVPSRRHRRRRQSLRGGQGREPVGAAALRGAVICPRERRGGGRGGGGERGGSRAPPPLRGGGAAHLAKQLKTISGSTVRTNES